MISLNHAARMIYASGLAGLMVLTSVAGADTIHLKTGKQLTGTVISDKAGMLSIESAAGVISVKKSDVARVEANNARVLQELGSIVAAGDGQAVLDKADRLDTARFTPQESAALKELTIKAKAQVASAAAQQIDSQDTALLAEANEKLSTYGWRESADFLQKSLAQSPTVLPKSEQQLYQLMAKFAELDDVKDHRNKLQACIQRASGQHQLNLRGIEANWNNRIASMEQVRLAKQTEFAKGTAPSQQTMDRFQIASKEPARMAARKLAMAPLVRQQQDAKNKLSKLRTQLRANNERYEMNLREKNAPSCRSGNCPAR